MSKYTEGPFVIWEDPEDGGFLTITSDARLDDGMVPFARVELGYDDDTDADQRAFARMAVAAPELLEALKAVVKVADRKTAEFDLARAAIAKAEG